MVESGNELRTFLEVEQAESSLLLKAFKAHFDTMISLSRSSFTSSSFATDFHDDDEI